MRQQWMAVLGSSRKDKNTEALAKYIISALNDREIDVEIFWLENQQIATCTGCESCIQIGKCRIKDHVTDLIECMKKADGLIFASPTYNYNISAQMKAFIDRTFCLNDYTDGGCRSRLPSSKKAIVVAVCAGNSEDSMGYTVEGMVKPAVELGIKVVDVFKYYNTKYSPVSENDKIRDIIFKRIKDSNLI